MFCSIWCCPIRGALIVLLHLAPNVVFAAFGTGRKRQFGVLQDPPSLQPVFETLFISSLTRNVELSSAVWQKLYDGVMLWKPACVCCSLV